MNRNLANGLLLAPLAILALVLGVAFVGSGGMLATGAPGDVVAAAPEAQATSTATLTPSATPTNTSTPGPATCSLGGVPIYCPHAPGGNNLLGVSLEGGSGTIAVAVPTLQAVQGRISAGTPVTGVPPVLMGAQDYSNNLQVPHINVPATGDNASDARLQVSSFVQGQSTTGNTMVNILANPTTGALLVQGSTPVPTWTPQPNVFSGTPVPVRGQMVNSVATIIRPTGTPTVYPTLGVINQSATTPVALTFQNVCRVSGGSATITLLRMLTDQSSNVARYRLHLYNTAPTPIADTTQFSLLYTNAALRAGYIDVYALQSEGTGSTAANAINPDVRLPVVCANGDTNLYGQLEAIDSFTPAAGQQFFISLTASQD